jgi:hypothetical protein
MTKPNQKKPKKVQEVKSKQNKGPKQSENKKRDIHHPKGLEKNT